MHVAKRSFKEAEEPRKTGIIIDYILDYMEKHAPDLILDRNLDHQSAYDILIENGPKDKISPHFERISKRLKTIETDYLTLSEGQNAETQNQACSSSVNPNSHPNPSEADKMSGSKKQRTDERLPV